MKQIAFALLLLVSLWPLHADSDILVNSTFSDGHSHWQGDAKDIDSGDLGSDTPAPGAIVQLKKDKWTKVYQLFTVRDQKLFYTVSFKTSNDYKLASRESDYAPADLGDIPGIAWQWSLPANCWSIMIQGGDNYTQKELQPSPVKLGQPQTLSGHFIFQATDVECVFVLAFPPGEGSVTLTTVSLSKTDPDAQP